MKAAGVGLGVVGATALGVLAVGAASRLPRNAAPEAGPVAPPEVTAAAPSPTPAPTSTPQEEIPPYDGRFTFLRIQYGTGGGDMRSFGRFRRGRGRQAPWEHDRPRAEQHFARILEATTLIDARQDEEAGIYLPLDDPRLFEYPVAYICEVGYWRPTDAQAEALRNYLLKGGFLIVDDFRGRDLNNFEDQMQRVLPGAQLFQLTGEHEVFDSFFRIPHPENMVTYYDRGPPVYLGMFEDNDPTGRLMVILNYNNDIGEYWEFSDQGYVPIDLSNEAYKFGVNYVVYGLTH